MASVCIYLDGNKATLEREYDLLAIQRTIEYERQLWEEMRTAYGVFATVLGRMAAELDARGDISEKARQDFSGTYWGTLQPLLISREVELEVVRLRNDLRDLAAGRSVQDKIRRRIVRILRLCISVLAQHAEGTNGGSSANRVDR